jgi:hypothetical protein
MPRVFRRETIIALRARRQAHAIAREVLNPHVDVLAVPCRACGGDVPIEPHHLGATTICPACGASVLLPASYVAGTDEETPDVNPRHVYYERKPLPPRQELTTLRCFVLAALIGLLFITVVMITSELLAR